MFCLSVCLTLEGPPPSCEGQNLKGRLSLFLSSTSSSQFQKHYNSRRRRQVGIGRICATITLGHSIGDRRYLRLHLHPVHVRVFP